MKTTTLADARSQFSKYVDDVVTTHERVTITRNGKPAAVLISAEDLAALEETLFWARQGQIDERGPAVDLAAVTTDVQARRRTLG